MLPIVKFATCYCRLSRELRKRFCMNFCETGVYSTRQTSRGRCWPISCRC
ncbi:hypothetical protein X992_5503 [Burkholderia pseudomallei MSHR5492]|nr:hypothetical protein X992_5503 [Burkholderia pseudomallei MSHR5492]